MKPFKLSTASRQRLVHDGRGLWRIPQPSGFQLGGVCEEEGADFAEADPETHFCAETADQWGKTDEQISLKCGGCWGGLYEWFPCPWEMIGKQKGKLLLWVMRNDVSWRVPTFVFVFFLSANVACTPPPQSQWPLCLNLGRNQRNYITNVNFFTNPNKVGKTSFHTIKVHYFYCRLCAPPFCWDIRCV